MSDQYIKVLENVLEMICKCLKTLKRREGFGESCGKREGLGIRTQPGCITPPTGDEWALKEAEMVKALSKMRSWNAPGPDKTTNFWWKRAGTLYKGVV